MNEGLIKYSLNFKQTEAPKYEDIKDLENVRSRLFSLGFIGCYDNGVGFGNLSVLNANDKKCFYISGTQTGNKKYLNCSDYARVDSCDLENFCINSSGIIKPSSEAFTHKAIYELDNNINAVIHIHSLKLWNFMLLNDYCSTGNFEYGTVDMMNDVFRIFENKNALNIGSFVMKGHQDGIVTFGQNIFEAEKVLYEIVKRFIEND